MIYSIFFQSILTKLRRCQEDDELRQLMASLLLLEGEELLTWGNKQEDEDNNLLYLLRKIQGQTICSKVVGNLGTQERSDGLSYVIFSRVHKFDDVAIDGGMTWEHITKKISNRVSFQKRKEMERTLLKAKIEETLLKYEELFGNVPTDE